MLSILFSVGKLSKFLYFHKPDKKDILSNTSLIHTLRPTGFGADEQERLSRLYSIYTSVSKFLYSPTPDKNDILSNTPLIHTLHSTVNYNMLHRQ